MRKVIFIIIALTITLTCESSAQLLNHYGVKVAISSAGQKYDYKYGEWPGLRRRIGFNVAIYAEWLHTSYFSLVTQCEYAQRGKGDEFVLTDENSNILGDTTYWSRVDYVSIPIFAKVHIPAGSITPYFIAGPRLDYLLGHASDNIGMGYVYDHFKKTTLGGTIGIGAQLDAVLPVGAIAEVRYNFDLEDSYSSDVLRIRNNVFDIWLGVAF